MAGAAADVDDGGRGRREVGAEVLVDHVGPDLPAQRAVMAVDETLAELGPGIAAGVVRHARQYARASPQLGPDAGSTSSSTGGRSPSAS